MKKFEVLAVVYSSEMGKQVEKCMGSFDTRVNASLFAKAYEEHYSVEVEIVDTSMDRNPKVLTNELKEENKRNRYEEGQNYARFTLQEEGILKIKTDLMDMVRQDLMSHFDLGYYDECVKIVAVEEGVAEAQKEVLEAIIKLAEDFKEEKYNYSEANQLFNGEKSLTDIYMGKYLASIEFCQKLKTLKEGLINEE